MRLVSPLSLVLGLFLLPALAGTPIRAAEIRHEAVLNGVRLVYWTSRPLDPGDEPVVFLHGGPGYDSYSFRRTAGTRLSSHVPMVYLDQRGSGESERPWRADYATQRLVEDVEALRVALGVQRIVPMGHSYGGMVAAEYAVAHPERVARLVLLDAAIDVPAAMASWMGTLESTEAAALAKARDSDAGRALARVPAGDECALAKARLAFLGVAQQHMDSSQAFHDRQQFHQRAALEEQRRLDAESGVRNTGEIGGSVFAPDSGFPCYRLQGTERLKMPVLVAVGAHDRAVGVEPQRALAQALPSGELAVFAGSAHFPYAEEPAAFDARVLHFLAQGK